jgi:hypothetical protein
MRKPVFVLLLVCAAIGLAVAQMGKPGGAASSGKPDFQITASYIEACSCDMFCPCYFNPHSTHKRDGHYFCEANLVMKVDKGHYKDVKLDGVKVWIATDLGHEWAEGKLAWLGLTFDSSVTEAQKNAMVDILPKLYAPKFTLVGVDSAPIEWKVDEAAGVATARLAGGKGEVILDRWKGPDAKKESVLQNVKYFNAQSNDGFRMWKTRQHHYNNHGKKFEYKGTNGFLITIHFSGQATQATAD